jgi:hypothetical protein
MSRPTVTPDKPVNLEQLTAELGGLGLCRSEETWEIVPADDTDLTQQQLEDAVAAHAAEFPPDPDDEFRKAVEAATSIADLKAALLGTAGPGAEPRRQWS